MDLRQLRYFVAVARERNFTRASKHLHITQPPLSRQIQLLEEEIGVPLLLRASRPLQLTEAGRLFYEQAIQVLGRVEQMTSATRKLGLNQQRTLSIGFVASTLYGGLPVLVRRLRQQLPEMDIQLVELTSMQQVDALKSGRIDLGFGRLRINDNAVVRTVLKEESLVLAMLQLQEPRSQARPVTLSELAGRTLIVYPKEPRPSFADQILTLVNDHGVRLSGVIEVKELQTALGLVASDAGVCIVPHSARLRTDLEYKSISDADATSPIILSHRINDDAWYISFVKKLASKVYETGQCSDQLLVPPPG